MFSLTSILNILFRIDFLSKSSEIVKFFDFNVWSESLLFAILVPKSMLRLFIVEWTHEKIRRYLGFRRHFVFYRLNNIAQMFYVHHRPDYQRFAYFNVN